MSTLRLTSQERRAAIIDAAVALFSEKGFRGTTTRELAAKVGVSEPVLYQHFTTKRDLYSAILEQLASSSDIPIAALSLPLPGQDRDFLTGLAHKIIDWHRVNPAFLRLLLLSAIEGHVINDLMHQRYTKVFLEQLVGYFAGRMENGVFRHINPERAAQAFISLASHYAFEVTLFKNGCGPNEDQGQTVDAFIDIFLEGIKA